MDNTYNIDSSDVQLLLRINHKNVIKFAEIIDGFMMLEYADCGSLKQLLHGDEQREYSLRNALDWMHQAAKVNFNGLFCSSNSTITPRFLGSEVPALLHLCNNDVLQVDTKIFDVNEQLSLLKGYCTSQ